jgi:hypothetical protein
MALTKLNQFNLIFTNGKNDLFDGVKPELVIFIQFIKTPMQKSLGM